jgi:dienelactone hydrolase
MLKWYGWVGLAVWIGGAVVIGVAMNWDFRSETVNLRLPDGTPVSGTLYRPTIPMKNVPVVVVLHGTALAHQSCAPGLAIPLAQHGYLTLAIDLLGHGHSGGEVPRWELDQPLRMLETLTDHPEVDAAIDLLKSEPGFEQESAVCLARKSLTAEERQRHPDNCVRYQRLALVGHSRGGWVAANVGFRRPDVASVVTIGAPAATCDLNRPHNLLILTGGRDELFPTACCEKAISRATDGAIAASDQAFGCFWEMNARRLLKVNGASHLTELANPWVTRKVVQWVASSLDIDSGEIPGGWLLTLTTGLILTTVGGVPACRWATHGTANALLGKPTVVPEAGRWWILGLFFFLLAFVPWLVMRARGLLELGPIYFLGPSLGLAAATALAALIAATVLGRRTPSAASGARGQGSVVGVAAFLVAAVWVGLPWGYTWLGLVPDGRRALLALVALPLTLPLTLSLAHFFGRLTALRSATVAALLLRGAAWAVVPSALWFANQFLVIDFYPVSVVPVGLVASSFVFPFALWLVADRPGLTVSRAVAHALGLSWLLAAHLPFVR